MEDDELIPLSALQHYLYCPRQCALIHVERLWAENRYTAEGRLIHDRADEPGTEMRHGIRTATAMPLINRALGMTGIADVVEFRETPDGLHPYPVEYKRGRPKQHQADEVQLCAQALCLEEMLDTRISEGALFYGKTRRRRIVAFDTGLRALTVETVQHIRRMVEEGQTPAADYEPKRCDACSLNELCQPRSMGRRGTVIGWLERQLRE
ncbi:MAG TPA: CRISPR-associated protein Cas4 [Candidatus Competibacteraceae bacterium]|nr:CRISPR-associated protein Cas4 [Candidatus Competibacteraceae bacterium]